ncbi:MAG: T9SS type A sorting domain-containing protein [Bacteroidetes bacterium]|nr:T9SS type A sorting domain-containing protein [Bacteroidota bacterium]
MKTSLFLILFFLFLSNVYPQLYDSFSDGNFTSDPVWSGDTAHWEITQKNSSGTNGDGTTNTLRLAVNISESGTKYLSSQKTGSWGNEQAWSFWMGRKTGSAASSDNQSIFWLWANESNLLSNTVDGYIIKFGKTGADNIILQKVTDGVETTILISDSAVISEDDISLMIRVTRDNESLWSLYTSILPAAGGEGPASTEIPSFENTNLPQGSVTDNSYTLFDNGYLGIMAAHTSGTTALEGAEFDQIYFDTDASSLLPVELLNFNAKETNNKILLTWDTATEINNYGFEIQRTNTNSSFSENETGVWQSIGFVNGYGNSNSFKHYTFYDNEPKKGINKYRLKQIDFNGAYEFSDPVSINFVIYSHLKLEQNYPNPFNPITKISFIINELPISIKTNSLTSLNIYDALGQLVEVLLEKELRSGRYELEFNGSKLSSGLYYYTLKNGLYSDTKKMLLIK